MDTKIQRAALDIKSDAEGRFSGIAMKYHVVDSYNDRTLPGAFTATIAENGGRIRVNKQHENDPLGWGTLRDTADALLIDVQLEMSMQAARDLFSQIKANLVGGLSIGYVVRKSRNVKGVRELLDIQLMEVSAVTWQSVPGALIDAASVKAHGGDDMTAVIAALASGLKSDSVDLRVVSDALNVLIAGEAEDLADDMLQSVAARIARLEGRIS